MPPPPPTVKPLRPQKRIAQQRAVNCSKASRANVACWWTKTQAQRYWGRIESERDRGRVTETLILAIVPYGVKQKSAGWWRYASLRVLHKSGSRTQDSESCRWLFNHDRTKISKTVIGVHVRLMVGKNCHFGVATVYARWRSRPELCRLHSFITFV